MQTLAVENVWNWQHKKCCTLRKPGLDKTDWALPKLDKILKEMDQLKLKRCAEDRQPSESPPAVTDRKNLSELQTKGSTSIISWLKQRSNWSPSTYTKELKNMTKSILSSGFAKVLTNYRASNRFCRRLSKNYVL